MGLALVLCEWAWAGSFAVSPVRVTLDAKQPVAAIRVQNEGKEPTVVQLQTFNWSQHEGDNVLTESNDVLATPPIMTIPAGGARIVRVGLRRPADAQHELTYRLLLREVPSANTVSHGNLRVALQISMPVFVLPETPIAADVHWRAVVTSDGKIRLMASNSGSEHIQLGHLELLSARAGATIASQDTSTYLLPDNGHEWTLPVHPLPAVGSVLQVTSQLAASKLQAEVRVEGS